ncbi:MAG: glycosyltransferase [Lachnospiraceae bacterium]|nr:glycosyltransferase [Lachnospiraceae bacterium]
MATFNGSRYIEDQLKSLLNQSKMPDEVIIRDDRSTDNTAEKVFNFIENNNLQERWKLTVNDKNIGWQRNFYEAVKETTGDIIFFSDQDDIWLPDKVETLTTFMKEKNAGCVYGSIILIDEAGNELNETRNTHGIDKKPGQIPFDCRFNTAIVMGCRMCISREIANIYIGLKHPMPDHDCQCARLALLYSTLWRIEKPIMRYRIHKGNNSGIVTNLQEGSTTLEFRKRIVKENADWLRHVIRYNECQLKEVYFNFINPEETKIEKTKFEELSSEKKEFKRNEMLKRILKMQEERFLYLSHEHGVSWFRLLKYRKSYSGISMLIGDFAYRNGINRILGTIYRCFKKFFIR